MRIKVLLEKKFETVLISASQQRWHTPDKRSSVVQRERDRNDKDLRSESEEKQCLFCVQLEQTTTGKAVSYMDIGNIVNNSSL